MNNRDFWQAVYIAAIANGHSPNVARGIADDAVTHLEDTWDE